MIETHSAEKQEAMDWDMDMVDDPLEEISNLESKFYNQGYDSGHAHGRLHGLFEGRELGKEKAWELWEEVGFYDGWASMWIQVLQAKAAASGTAGSKRGKEARALNHAQVLVELINTFPTINPTQSINSNAVSEMVDDTPAADIDLASLLSLIRARYRLLCSSLGTRPRLASATIVEANPGSGAAAAGRTGSDGGEAEGVVQGIEGPMKGVDTRQLRF
ncbi:hypothetical protein L198_04369 [Cryptococcus wingfieldii CBS 7118]|uniref:Essential protein Yae1 N-terminal domain-containing protein n=1 Tax=Cryptococcus wingfieldii CBS 7118 TaxID=1295528 RepID=A0A1E3J736_9TREE|nr:hypothetical protein L198_04369 [Cryptococcus wingfieldii CBS 7118]ODN95751.1 hypothetical protein L198_04369 [Cryptococcus wingfieldii CBS 7118]